MGRSCKTQYHQSTHLTRDCGAVVPHRYEISQKVRVSFAPTLISDVKNATVSDIGSLFVKDMAKLTALSDLVVITQLAGKPTTGDPNQTTYKPQMIDVRASRPLTAFKGKAVQLS